MATQAGGKRPFPAVVIVLLLFVACVFPGQGWVAPGVSRIAGQATLTPSLTILDIPVHLSFTIDLILVPCLFMISYFVVVFIASIVRGVPIGHELVHRLSAVFTGTFLLLLCLTAGGLLAYAAQVGLPPRILKSLASLGINADLNTGFGPVHLRGDAISLLALLVGLVFFFNRIRKSPETKRPVQLTREQRMTPYQRMLQERQHAQLEKSRPQRLQQRPAQRALCNNQPLLSLRPEAVNYRPM
jgi:hypothetical protein